MEDYFQQSIEEFPIHSTDYQVNEDTPEVLTSSNETRVDSDMPIESNNFASNSMAQNTEAKLVSQSAKSLPGYTAVDVMDPNSDSTPSKQNSSNILSQATFQHIEEEIVEQSGQVSYAAVDTTEPAKQKSDDISSQVTFQQIELELVEQAEQATNSQATQLDKASRKSLSTVPLPARITDVEAISISSKDRYASIGSSLHGPHSDPYIELIESEDEEFEAEEVESVVSYDDDFQPDDTAMSNDSNFSILSS